MNATIKETKMSNILFHAFAFIAVVDLLFAASAVWNGDKSRVASNLLLASLSLAGCFLTKSII